MSGWKKLDDKDWINVPNARRVKLLADEDIEQELIDHLRESGINVKSIREENLAGRSDSFVEATARKEKRFLLTKNSRDFLNDRKFPINKTFGIIVIDGDMKDVDKYARAAGIMRVMIIPHQWAYTQSKIQVGPHSLSIKGRDYTGKITMSKFKFTGRKVYYWED